MHFLGAAPQAMVFAHKGPAPPQSTDRANLGAAKQCSMCVGLFAVQAAGRAGLREAAEPPQTGISTTRSPSPASHPSAPGLQPLPPLHPAPSRFLCLCLGKKQQNPFPKAACSENTASLRATESPQLKQAEHLLLLSSCCQRQHLPLALPPLGSLPRLPLRKAPGGRGFVSLFLPNRFALLSHVITVPRRPPP